MENQVTIATICDEFYDDVIIYKLFNIPTLNKLKMLNFSKLWNPFAVMNLKFVYCIIVTIKHVKWQFTKDLTLGWDRKSSKWKKDLRDLWTSSTEWSRL